jgi:hypothetical protein
VYHQWIRAMGRDFSFDICYEDLALLGGPLAPMLRGYLTLFSPFQPLGLARIVREVHPRFRAYFIRCMPEFWSPTFHVPIGSTELYCTWWERTVHPDSKATCYALRPATVPVSNTDTFQEGKVSMGKLSESTPSSSRTFISEILAHLSHGRTRRHVHVCPLML